MTVVNPLRPRASCQPLQKGTCWSPCLSLAGKGTQARRAERILLAPGSLLCCRGVSSGSQAHRQVPAAVPEISTQAEMLLEPGLVPWSGSAKNPRSPSFSSAVAGGFLLWTSATPRGVQDPTLLLLGSQLPHSVRTRTSTCRESGGAAESQGREACQPRGRKFLSGADGRRLREPSGPRAGQPGASTGTARGPWPRPACPLHAPRPSPTILRP